MVSKISCIIPAYNEARYLKNCLKSIKSQRFRGKYEVVVVNNGSTDDTKEIAKSYGVRVIDEPKRGVAIAKNTGARNSTYDILLFIDADCVLPEDHLSKIVSKFTNSKSLDAFGGPYIYKDGGLAVYFITKHLKYFYFYSKLLKALSGITLIPGGNFVIKKSVFKKVRGFNENIRDIVCPEDLELCLRLAKSNHRVEIDPTLSVTSSFRRQLNPKAFKDCFYRLFMTAKYLSSPPSLSGSPKPV